MARVASKKELLERAEQEYALLMAVVNALSDDDIATVPVCGAWTTKDLMAHLYAWQQLYFEWQRGEAAGEPVHLPAVGLRWSEIPRLNDDLYRRHRDLPVADARTKLETSHARLLGEVAALSEAAVMRPGAFAWTGRNALETYLVSVTSAHYRWARKEISKGLRARR